VTTDVVARAVRKAALRLLPLLGLALFVSFLDRVNLGFAAVTMNRDLGLSQTVYGLAAGMFFIGYFVFEVPSNLILQKVGARLWIGRIMITWGLVSGATAFVSSAFGLNIVRLLLGFAEAGFAPGIVLYLGFWFPRRYRSRILACFLIAQPLSAVVGAPLSGLLLLLDGVFGLKGWQWLFLMEAVPSVVLGVIMLFALPNNPAEASWLTPDERNELILELRAEHETLAATGISSLTGVVLNPRVILLALANVGMFACAFGLVFFLPQIVQTMGASPLASVLLSAIPYGAGAISTLAVGYWADRAASPERLAFASSVVVAIGLVGTALFGVSPGALLTLSVAAAGLFAFLPAFWSIPARFLIGTAAAAGIAMINSLGSLGGFVGPFLFGWLVAKTGGFSAALVLFASWAVVSGLLVLLSAHLALRAAGNAGPQSATGI
jgi:ACS family tartrate transporter-like MFS transporter